LYGGIATGIEKARIDKFIKENELESRAYRFELKIRPRLYKLR